MQLPPWPLKAVVISQDPDQYGLNVSVQGFVGGQMPSLPVKVLTSGPRDAVRGHYPALPLPGTHGIVIFASGDPRNGHWLGCTDPSLIDANALSPQVTGLEYHAHYGGGWSWRGQDGTLAEVWPDGTSLLAGAASGLPSPTRHTLTSGGVRQRTAFLTSQRVSGTAQAVAVAFSHPSGAKAALSVSGAWSLLSAPGQTATLAVSGGTSITINADGSVSIHPVGNATVAVSGNLLVTGNVTAGAATGDQVTLQLHVHGTGSAAAGTVIPTAGH